MKRVVFFSLLLFTGIILNGQVNETKPVEKTKKTKKAKKVKDAEKGDTITLSGVLNNYYVAIAGSKAKLEEVKSLKSEGDMSFSQFPDPAPFTNKIQSPNKMITILSVLDQTIKQGFDGEKGFSNVMKMSDEQSEELKRRKGVFPELYYTEKEAVLDGVVPVEEKKAYKITITDGKNKTIAYFDVQSGLKIKEEFVRATETLTKTYSDYKDFEGYNLPTKMITVAPGQTTTQMVKAYTINPEFTDADFSYN